MKFPVKFNQPNHHLWRSSELFIHTCPHRCIQARDGSNNYSSMNQILERWWKILLKQHQASKWVQTKLCGNSIIKSMWFCFSSFCSLFKGKPLQGNKKKKQAITDNAIGITTSLCRWHTHGNFIPITLSCVWFWMFYWRTCAYF